jgi:hypothetical protein
MVKLKFVNDPTFKHLNQPISAFRALQTGFERVAANPLLILPPLLLDLALWLGPHLNIAPLIPEGVAWLGLPSAPDPALADQIALIESLLTLFRDRFNVLVALSIFPAGMPFNLLVASMSLPPGVPSLMARRLPILTPFGEPLSMGVSSPAVFLLLWTGLTAIGLGVSVLYHRWLVRQLSPESEMGSPWRAWGRAILFFLAVYASSVLILFTATVAANIMPILGAALVMFGLGALFWATIYFAFTAHGLIRYDLGVLAALRESVLVVRSNVLSTFGFLVLAFGIVWISTNFIWFLPEENSWYTLLALVGFAFVSAMLLIASYSFFDARRVWLARVQSAIRIYAEGKTDADVDSDD